MLHQDRPPANTCGGYNLTGNTMRCQKTSCQQNYLPRFLPKMEAVLND